MAQPLPGAGAPEESRGGATKPLRVPVEASKDGGLWWFPQAPPAFDPRQPHQGKPLADAMRARGRAVTELPRGEVVTGDRLKGVDPSTSF
ncbi:MAG: hypothetical protein ACYC23_07355 [Limisphaerales bacterium]